MSQQRTKNQCAPRRTSRCALSKKEERARGGMGAFGSSLRKRDGYLLAAAL
jgi:hypothetical protein